MVCSYRTEGVAESTNLNGDVHLILVTARSVSRDRRGARSQLQRSHHEPAERSSLVGSHN